MELLKRAARESRRRVQLRDWILLVLRCLAVLLFGLALAQPVMDAASRVGAGNQASELIVLIDNSMSMAYEGGAGTRLDEAKQVVRQLVQEMPPGSSFRIVPLCGSLEMRWEETTPIKADALQALELISTVDRSLTLEDVAAAATRACRETSPLPRRIMVLSDLQAVSWASLDSEFEIDNVPPIQVVDLFSPEWENNWIADVRVDDGLVDSAVESVIRVRVGAHAAVGQQLEITLAVDGKVVASRVLEFEAGSQLTEVVFRHRFEAEILPGEVHWANVVVGAGSDRLPTDNQRHLLVPVAKGLPVVFVDQYGDQEDSGRFELGESLPLRRLLAPQGQADSGIRARHLRIEQVTAEALSESRLVVVAGVEDPAPAAESLANFLMQGGRLLIAAGGAFNADRWNAFVLGETSQGILPAPLATDVVGGLPGRSGYQVAPFLIEIDSIRDESLFRFGDATDEELTELYSEPLFFQAVRMLVNKEQQDGPRVLARFSDSAATPFLVEQSVGQGRVIFVGSGLQSHWNTIAKTNAVLLFDRLARRMLAETLDPRDFVTADQLEVRLPGWSRREVVRLQRPTAGGFFEELSVGLIKGDGNGVVVDRAFERGLYRIESDAEGGERQSVELVVNGLAEESDLTPIERDLLDSIEEASGTFTLIGQDDPVSQPTSSGGTIWWWFAFAVLAVLLAEMATAANRPAVPDPGNRVTPT